MLLMSHRIVISDPVFTLLDHEARRNRLSPSELAERLLAERLHMPPAQWQVAFQQLISDVHKRMEPFDHAEIEADISAASADVLSERHARRSPG